MSYKKTICVDFDGVIHWYRKGWNGGTIYDEPVPGAIEWLIKMAGDDRFQVMIYSSRSKDPAGVDAMRRWLLRNGIGEGNLLTIEFPTQKPAAWITIDDRAICFEGSFPTAEEIDGFTPWMKR